MKLDAPPCAQISQISQNVFILAGLPLLAVNCGANRASEIQPAACTIGRRGLMLLTPGQAMKGYDDELPPTIILDTFKYI